MLPTYPKSKPKRLKEIFNRPDPKEAPARKKAATKTFGDLVPRGQKSA